MLGDHALQPAFEARLEQLDAVLLDVVRNEDVASGLDRFGQPGASSHHGLPLQGPAFQVQGVEGKVGGGNLILHPRARGQTLAKARIVGAAVDVGRDQLAVDDAARRHAFGRGHDLGNVGREVGQPAVLEADAAVRIAEEDAAQAVPLHLEEVLGRAERSFG